jgi:hypothetical protein
LDLRGSKGLDAGEDSIVKSFITCMLQAIKSRRTRWVGNVARMGELRNAYSILVGKPEGKRPRRRRWEEIIRMDIRKIWWEDVD